MRSLSVKALNTAFAETFMINNGFFQKFKLYAKLIDWVSNTIST